MKDCSDLVPAQVWLHASFDGNFSPLVSQWEMVSLQLQDGFATCKEKEDIRILPASSIHVALWAKVCTECWCHCGSGADQPTFSCKPLRLMFVRFPCFYSWVKPSGCIRIASHLAVLDGLHLPKFYVSFSPWHFQPGSRPLSFCKS